MMPQVISVSKMLLTCVADRKEGRLITNQQHQQSMHRMNVYKQWFLDTVMQVDSKYCLVVIPTEPVTPTSRDSLPPYDFHSKHRI